MAEDTVLETDVFNHEPGHAAKHNAVNEQVNWLTEFVGPEGGLSASFPAIPRAVPQPLIPDAATVYATRFQTGHGWTQVGGTVSPNSTEDAIFGTQSLKMVTAVGGNAITDSPGNYNVNLTDRVLGILYKCDDPTKLDNIAVYAGTNGFSAYYVWSIQPDTVVEGWRYIELPWQNATVSGSPTRADCDQIRVNATAVTGQAATVRLNAVTTRLNNQYPDGVISFTFDDGLDNTYTKALPVMSRLGYPATAYILTDEVGEAGLMTLDQLRDLQAKHGWDISAHARTAATHEIDLRSGTTEQRDTEYGAMRRWLLANGFNRGADHFAAPHGWVSDDVSDDALKWFRTIRGTASVAFSTTAYAPHRPTNVYALSFDASAIPVATIKARMDIANANGLWFVPIFHGVTDAASSGGSISVTDLTEIVDYAASLGMAVRTVSDALDLA
jgi:peptidoglycan/xylan/chitin deacetylase (PgdA/CDA1 family)